MIRYGTILLLVLSMAVQIHAQPIITSAQAVDCGRLHVFWSAPDVQPTYYTLWARPGGFRSDIPGSFAQAAISIVADKDYTLELEAFDDADQLRGTDTVMDHSMPCAYPAGGFTFLGNFKKHGTFSYAGRSVFLFGRNLPQPPWGEAWAVFREPDGTLSQVLLPIPSTGTLDVVPVALTASRLVVVLPSGSYELSTDGRTLLSQRPLQLPDALATTVLQDGRVIVWTFQSKFPAGTEVRERFQFLYSSQTGDWKLLDWTSPQSSGVAQNPTYTWYSGHVLTQHPGDKSLWALRITVASHETRLLRINTDATLTLRSEGVFVSQTLDGQWANQQDESWLQAVPLGDKLAIAYQRWNCATNSSHYQPSAYPLTLFPASLWAPSLFDRTSCRLAIALADAAGSKQFVDGPGWFRWIMDYFTLRNRNGALSVVWKPPVEDQTYPVLMESHYSSGAWSAPYLVTIGSRSWEEWWYADGDTVLAGTPEGTTRLFSLPGISTPPPPVQPPTITINSPASRATVKCGSSVLLRATVSEGATVAWSNGAAGANAAWIPSCKPNSSGWKMITATAKNSAGTATSSVWVYVRK